MSRIKKNWDKLALGLIMLLNGVLSIWGIWTNGYGNEFYSACVKSMLTSWKNFFFVSLDSAGFVTVDKPPVALWIQAAFAKVFGFSGWSVILPQGLAAVGTTFIVYHAVKRYFGKAAGLISALVLALSPIFIVISRTNNTDSILIFFMVLATWAMLKAADLGKFKWLALSAVLLGIAYNTKTLQAFLILPALFAGYFFTANTTWKKRFLHMVAATLILITVSLSWSVAVDLTPASERPYVDNSTNNSELELAINYNGLQRLTGMGSNIGKDSSLNDGGTGDAFNGQAPGNRDGNSGTVTDGAITDGSAVDGFNMPNIGGGMVDGGGGGGFSHGSQSLLRMFNSELGGQDSWLLPFGFFAILALLLGMLKKYSPEKEERRKLLRSAIIWGGSVITMFVWFSVAQFFHEYYIATLAPFLAALVGIGVVQMWRLFKEDGLLGYLLPVSFAATAAVQVVMLESYWKDYATILAPAILIISVAPIAVLTVLKILRRKLPGKIPTVLISIALAGLMLAPAIWTGYSLTGRQGNFTTPTAGPSVAGSRNGIDGAGAQRRDDFGQADNFQIPYGAPDGRQGGSEDGNINPGVGGGSAGPGSGGGYGVMPDDGGNFGGNPGGGGMSASSGLINYLLKNYSREKWLVAVPNSNTAASIILQTDKAVMSVGGFGGRDKILTVSSLEEMVKNHELRYFMVTGTGSSDEITAWVKQHGKAVSASEYGGSSGGAGGTLYDLYAYNS